MWAAACKVSLRAMPCKFQGIESNYANLEIVNSVPGRAHFLSSLSFIEFQTIEFEHASSSTFIACVF